MRDDEALEQLELGFGLLELEPDALLVPQSIELGRDLLLQQLPTKVVRRVRKGIAGPKN